MDSFSGRSESTLSANLPSEPPPFSKRIRVLFHYKPEKWWSFVICLITFIITLAIGLLALISKTSLYYGLFGDISAIRAHVLVLILILDFWVFCFNAALFYGIKYKNAVLIFLWIMSMLINWNIYVFARLIHLVDKAMEKEISVKDLYLDIGHLFMIVGIWLLMICIIWDYWQTISNITDIPELIEFLVQ